MTKKEFIAEYCRRWGVAWADILRYRSAVPSSDRVGWKMLDIDDHDDDQTVRSPLEPLPGCAVTLHSFGSSLALCLGA